MIDKYGEFKKGYLPDNLFSGLSVVAENPTNDGLPF
jgi:hypothetical protein